MIRVIDVNGYDVEMRGLAGVHRNLVWFATEDDKVLGVLVLDLVDHDFSWAVLTENDQGPGYTAIDIGHSLPTQDAAIAELHAAMERK